MRKLWIACLLAGSLWPVGAPGLPAEDSLDGLIHRRWEVADGLPNPAVRALAETPNGLLWVGTRTGLARFDGRSFELLANDSVSGLVVDPEGVLWAGTEGSGLLRYQEGRSRTFGVDDGLPSATVTAMALDRRGRLLVATSGGGVVLREGSLFTSWIRASELPGPVVALAILDDRVFLATSAALFVHQAGRLAAIAQGLPHPRALSFGAAGELFVATDEGLLQYSGGVVSAPLAGQSPRGALALQPDAGGILWLGGRHGLWRTQPQQGRIESFQPTEGVAKAVVSSMLLDRRGNLWLGSLDDGLHQLRQNPLRIWGRREGLASEIVNSVDEDPQGRIWLTARRGGLSRLDPSTGRLEQVAAGLTDEDLWSVDVDPQGGFWLGSNHRGLLQRKSEAVWQSFGPELGLPEGPVQAVRATRDGTVYMATDNGLGRLSGGRLEVFTKADGLPSNAVRDIFEEEGQDGQAGTLWIATLGGLARHLGNGRFEAFTAGPVIPEGVLSIWQDEEGALWLATVGGLVQVRQGRARSLTSRDGLYCDDLSVAIGDRRGYLWMGTAKGLVRVALAELRLRLEGRPIELHQWIFDRRSGLEAGISNNGTAALASRSGRLYFASRGGLVEVDPERLEPLPAPSLRLDEVLETPRPWWQSLTPATSGSRLVFRFSASTLAAPDELRLRYRLVGFDPAWRSAGSSRVAEYNRVPPGLYRFQLEAGDQEGRFAEDLAVGQEITVARRWPLQVAFAGLLSLLVGGGLALLHRVRIRWLERRKAELQREVEVALAELAVLRGMLPICSACKRIRDDQGYWEEMESFFNSRSRLEFERGVCPECDERLLERRASSGRVIRVARAVPGGAP